MAILSFGNARLAYGHGPLLDGAAFALEAGERVGLIGRNGAGKSALLKVAAGLESLDDGVVQRTQGLSIRYVAQEPELDVGATVFDAVAVGVTEVRALRAQYEAHAAGDDVDPEARGVDSDEDWKGVDYDALQARIETHGGWNWERRVDETMARLGLPREQRIGELSGGMRKKVALAQALVALPDVLLLDEPTNHLDVDAIDWLEELLRGFRGTSVFVSHDRAFLDGVATRIVELDRGQLRSYPGNFAAYEARKQAELAAEALASARADKLLAAEEAWVRQGVEARRTRSVSRVQRLQALRERRAQRRDAVARVRLEADAGLASGKIVAELRDVTMRFGAAAPLVRDFSATILRGDKVGVIGPNGAGKTTLLRLILGELEPSAGSVRRGTRLSVAYFDQLRVRLDPDATLADSVSPGSEWIETATGRKHVTSYLGDFLFSPARAQAPISTLSGGERNRVLLARLLALPANVLVLDEPTNDLDIDTLELLEELLQRYAGTVFLVSHDRRFLDEVVTSTIAWEGDVAPGLWREYEGGWSDWQRQRARGDAARAAPAGRSAPREAPAAPLLAETNRKAKRLGYLEQRELDALPDRIEALELEQKELVTLLGSAELYAGDPVRVEAAQQRFAQIDSELNHALERWETLASR